MSETKEKLKSEPWYAEGLRFQCQGSGKCCTSRGEYGYVYMTLEDRRRMAKVLKISTSAFTKKYCQQTEGIWHLREEKTRPDCMFLVGGKSCSVYEGRPTQCRTWPFWPEALRAKTWATDISVNCPGVGKGKLYSREEIEKIMNAQSRSEEKYGT
jgi:Fe-S-cluster containining protein